MGDEKRPFLGHLEEFRKRILFSLAGIIALSALSYIYAEKILRGLAKYSTPLVFISPEEAFLSYLKVSLFGGLVLSAPLVLFNILKFTWVALNKKEKNAFITYLLLSIFFFAAGALFSYYVALPAAMGFLLSFSSDFVTPYISVSRYISFCIFFILAFAVAFETPLFVVFLTKLKLVDSRLLRKKRKYAIVLLFIVAAVLTPPDVITQILLAVPLMVLYEISIIFARIAEKG
ncbi:MAG: twin arginine-targeting protein translocase TatC [Omnitrophica bacterium RBG_13_46_9]|nr:MAG: twin arginine-targeting protein translocase TatC [Omnitrophica bacterium RBG_13_46_9]